jgi:hypothetical protein
MKPRATDRCRHHWLATACLNVGRPKRQPSLVKPAGLLAPRPPLPGSLLPPAHPVHHSSLGAILVPSGHEDRVLLMQPAAEGLLQGTLCCQEHPSLLRDDRGIHRQAGTAYTAPLEGAGGNPQTTSVSLAAAYLPRPLHPHEHHGQQSQD